MDIDINPSDPHKPGEGTITTQRIIPGKGIERVQDDLVRSPDEASESTMDDSPQELQDDEASLL